jgi:hypothetical protein
VTEDKRDSISNYKYVGGFGSENINWKGGRNKCNGYNMLRREGHPKARKHGCYVYEHILVYEHYLKILFDEEVYIPRGIDVHHINGDKTDNRIANLEVMTHSNHLRMETTGRKMSEEAIQKRRETRQRNHPRKPPTLKPCECGCGTMLENPDKWGHKPRFKHGHGQRVNNSMKGKRPWNKKD